MTLNPVIARRTALAAGVAGAGAVALAACSSDSGTKSSKSSKSSKSDSSAGQDVATLADIKVGEAIAAKVDGKDVLVGRPTETTAVCFSAVCTHQGCTVQAAGAKLACPCHGSAFDAKTGAVINGPASAPLTKIAVKVDNGKVVTSSTG